jgi:tRNA threonylcarbamoyladenosine biosynthesis protein TsaB
LSDSSVLTQIDSPTVDRYPYNTSVLIIGIDTSGRNGSIALARAEESEFDVVEVVPLEGGTYSAELIPQFSALLVRHGLGKQDISAFAVATGPGSFTGLRVGISTVKGLAEILHRQIAAVSILETIAAHTNVDGRVIAALDAGRKELYVGEYEVEGARPRNGRESLLSQMEFAALLENNSEAELITPDAEVIELASNSMHLKVKQIDAPNSGEIARLGWLKIRSGETTEADVLDANYIRRSDAEIFSKPQS